MADGEIRKSSRTFREALKDYTYTPSGWLLARMNGAAVDVDGKKADPASLAERDKIALGLVQYELPRLAAIEAETTNLDKTHEEWLEELEGAANDDAPSDETTAKDETA